MPAITGRLEVCLTVRDPERSAIWYVQLLGLSRQYDHTSADGRLRFIGLLDPASALMLCLVGHADNPGDEFSEFRTGLDHLEFLVLHREDLQEWADHLDEMGVAHSGVKDLDYTENAMLTFRDPDNIQLEFFWRAPTGAHG
jgi:glyoxylase I family protein